MPPVRAGWDRGEAPGRRLSPASRGARKAGRSPSGAEGAQRGSAREQNALPSLAFASRSAFLSRVSARVPTGTGTARCESPGLSRGSCGGVGVCVPAAGRGALGKGRPGAFPSICPFLVCLSRPEVGERETGVTSSGRLRVTAVLSRGDGNTRGTAAATWGRQAAARGVRGLRKPHFHAGRRPHPPAGASREPAALKDLPGPMRWQG